MQTNSFTPIVRKAIDATPLRNLLASRSAVVLERIACGAGATNWYYCSSESSLELIQIRFFPGSAVSFYFDDRFRYETYSPDLKAALEAIIAQTREATVGILGEDGIRIDVDFIGGPNDLAEFLSALKPRTRVFYGAFPARDNDGVRAVTFILPDADGIVRMHPY